MGFPSDTFGLRQSPLVMCFELGGSFLKTAPVLFEFSTGVELGRFSCLVSCFIEMYSIQVLYFCFIDDCPVYLMGNKLDLINSSTHQAMNKKMKEFTLKNSKNNAIVDYFCVSAVNKENLDSSFQTVIDNLLNSGCGSSDSKRGLKEPEKESQNSKPSCGC